VILEQKNFSVLKGIALSSFCSGEFAFLLKRLKFIASNGDVFAANRQFRECFKT